MLDNVPIDITREEAGRIAAEILAIGEEEFRQAESFVRSGNMSDAIDAYTRLRSPYRGSWIDRVSAEQLQTVK